MEGEEILNATVSQGYQYFTPTNTEMIIFGVMAVLLILCVVTIAVLLRRNENVPDTLPPIESSPTISMPPPVPPLPMTQDGVDFGQVLRHDIDQKTIRKAEIKKEAAKLEKEYGALCKDLDKLKQVEALL